MFSNSGSPKKTLRLLKTSKKKVIVLTLALVSLLSLWNDARKDRSLSANGANGFCEWTTAIKNNGFPGGVDLIREVITVDNAVLQNTREALAYAHAKVEWSASQTNADVKKRRLWKNLNKFQAMPMSATVDRRPLIVKKQLMEDRDGWSANGKLLGCAMSSTTFVSNLADLRLGHHKDSKNHSCDVCFQFSNREDRDNFLPGRGYEPLEKEQASMAMKCFGGKPSVMARFSDWQQTDARFKGFGYPFVVDCTLPNGFEELTCEGISKMQKKIAVRDDLQAIHFRTKISLEGWFDNKPEQFNIHTSWPWTALMSHDDDRSKIADGLPKSWDDGNSMYVPNSPDELQLAHVEGPGYDQTTYKNTLSLRSMLASEESNGGMHFRLVVNLFHLIRNAPGSTHIVAVVDGQLNRTVCRLLDILHTKVSELYPDYGEAVFSDINEMKKMNLIPMNKMRKVFVKDMENDSGTSFWPDLTLLDLLHIRGIKIKVVPIPTPSLVFEKSVCGGQYAFAPYLAARYAADYQVMLFIDGDTAMIERGQSLKQILFNRFFAKNGTKCAGFRFRLIEQYVKPEFNNANKVLQCTHDLATDKRKWKYAVENCDLKEGHIAARTDSIFAFSVHHPDTLPAFAPKGVQNCNTSGNEKNDRFFFMESEVVQLHLRNRLRKPECSCFENQALES